MPWPTLPSQCEVCRRFNDARLCSSCIERFAPTTRRCKHCALRLDNALEVCGECLRSPPPFEHTVCAVDYAFPWDRMIVSMKFFDQPELAATLAALLVQAVRAAAMPLPALVLPVPLAPVRLAERGYNQAWELARRAAAALHLPAYAALLLRPIETAHQTELTRAQRLANLRAAFVVGESQRTVLAGQRVALVDDVLTTGATAQEATLALLRGGAAAVDVWVIARTAED